MSDSTHASSISDSTPASLYALLFGAVLLIAGVIGFFYESEFTSDESVRDSVFGVLEVNGWHNLIHVLTGAVGLVAYSAGAGAARTFALGFGTIYIGVAIWGFIVGDGDSILSIIPVNTEDNVLHAGIGVLGLAAGAASPPQQAPPAAAGAGAR